MPRIRTKSKLQNKSGSTSHVEDLKDSVMKKYQEKVFASFNTFKEIQLPNKKEQIHLISKRNLNSIGLIQLINTNGKIDKLSVVIYSIDEKTAKLLLNIAIENEIKIEVIISDIRNSAFKKKENAIILFQQNPKHFDLTFAGSYAKIILIKQNNDNFVVSTSANLSPNSRIEQYIIDNDENLFDFHSNWIKEVQKFIKEKNATKAENK